MSEENKELTPVQKVRKLEYVVLNSSPEEIARVYAEVGKVELSARALGIACRYRGVECVKALVEGGASFDVIDTDDYMVQTYGIYGEDYMVMLLENFPDKGIDVFVDTPKMYKSIRRANGTKLLPLPFEKRAETVRYLCEHKKEAAFIPGELLYYAILSKDEQMTAELKKLGVQLTGYRRKLLLTYDGMPDDLNIWTSLLKWLSAADFVPVLTRLSEELGEKFHNTQKIYKAISDKLYYPDNLRFYLKKFDNPTPNITEIMRSAIDNDFPEGLAFAESVGWLKQPKKRDEMIQYAAERKSVECTAWLLDFKNRTADLAAEQAKAEKRLELELNASPDSVIVLNTLWSYKKRKDGMIIINGYKGTQTEITVPAKIGKNPVTAIANEAFSPFRDVSPFSKGVIAENGSFLKTITSVTLSESITEIGERAFSECHSLRSVNIPGGVTEIKNNAFSRTAIEEIVFPSGLKKIGCNAFLECGALRELVIPDGVTSICSSAFEGCEKLETVKLPGSIAKIGWGVFKGCHSLRSVNIPDGVSEIENSAFFGTAIENIVLPSSLRIIDSYAFSECNSLRSLVIPEGVIFIGHKAFASCEKLETVELPRSFSDKQPENITYALGEIFSPDDKVTVIVPPGSFAEEYCKKYNLHYKLKGDQ